MPYLQVSAPLHRAVWLVVLALSACFVPQTHAADPAPLERIEGSTTLVALPDTQVYAQSFPDTFHAQTKWIVEQREAHNIAYMLHLGDITNNNNPPQWEVARAAISRLDGQVPYALAPGNHDYGPNGDASTRDTLLNEYFPSEKFAEWPSLSGVYEKGKLDNSFHLLTIHDQPWIIVALEWGPRDELVQWAEEVLTKHPDHRAILITHAYMYSDETRYDQARADRQEWNPHWYGTAKLPGGVNDGEQLWQKLVRKHKGMRLVLNGHVLNDGLGYLSSQGEHGNTVHQMLSNYQMKKDGGEGYLRLLEFHPDGKTLQVRTYSPLIDQYKTDAANQFTLTLE